MMRHGWIQGRCLQFSAHGCCIINESWRHYQWIHRDDIAWHRNRVESNRSSWMEIINIVNIYIIRKFKWVLARASRAECPSSRQPNRTTLQHSLLLLLLWSTTSGQHFHLSTISI
jgi:hypothetical protein